jgi:hypothetical protein
MRCPALIVTPMRHRVPTLGEWEVGAVAVR